MPVIHRDGLEIRKITTGSFDNNTYILVDPATNDAAIIDTPAEQRRFWQRPRTST